jgi:glycosyltransferase involved in cell wall biosynthesis
VPSSPDNQFERIPYTVLFLGRLGQRKGVFDLLKVSCMLAKEFPNFKLILGGDGDIESCKKFVHENSLENHVDIIGWVSGEEKERLLSTSNVFTLPSYNEGFPMGVLEAMSAGIPIIASTAGGIPDAITSGVEGTLIDPGDVQALYLALNDAFTDKTKHQTFAKQAKLKFESKFSLAVVGLQISSLYSNVINGTPK